MVEVVFIKDYATKKDGDVMRLDSMIASDLVHRHKVAKYKTEESVKKTVKETAKKTSKKK